MKKMVLFASVLALMAACKKEKAQDKEKPKSPQGTVKKTTSGAKNTIPTKGKDQPPKASVKSGPVKVVSLSKGQMTLAYSASAKEIGILRAITGRGGRLFGALARKPYGSFLYSVQGKKKIASYKGVTASAAFSSDGKYFAVNQGASVEVFTWPALTLYARFLVKPGKKKKEPAPKVGNNNFVSLSFSPDSKFLATGEINFGSFGSVRTQTISLFNLATKKAAVRHTLEEDEANACDVTFSADGKYLFAAVVGGAGPDGAFGILFPMEPENLVVQSTPFAPQKPVPFKLPCSDCVDAWFVAGPYYVVSRSTALKGAVHLYSIRTARQSAVLSFDKRAESDSVRVASVSGDGKLMAYGVSQEKIAGKDEFGNDLVDHIPYTFTVLRTEGFKPVKTVSASAFAFHPSSPYAAYVANGAVHLAPQGTLDKPVATVKVEGTPMALQFSEEGDFLLLATSAKVYQLAVK